MKTIVRMPATRSASLVWCDAFSPKASAHSFHNLLANCLGPSKSTVLESNQLSNSLIGVSLPIDYQLSDPPVCASLIGMGGVE